MSTRVLVIGAGGREHALAWGLARSPLVDEIVCVPGNPGMATIGECMPVTTTDPGAVTDLAAKLDADLVVVGPEDPLVAGVVDVLEASGRLTFGPRAAAARLEGSKAWMKDVLVAAGVPTARHATFGAGQEAAADAFLETLPGRYVVKTDGLAAGKGVVVTESIVEARDAGALYLSGDAFGDAGRTCVIEEGLLGPEVSLFALCDGRGAELVATAQDHKRAFDGDAGPNTGGMGAYSPVPFVSADVTAQMMERAILPTLAELERRGAPYRGVLYCGLMLTPDGAKVLEYNVRFGDPECQVLVPRLASDLFVHLTESATGTLATPVTLSDTACVGVVLAAEGYPPAPARKGEVISGLDRAGAHEGVVVFHSGTAHHDRGQVVTNGGRVLTVTAVAPDVTQARDRAYAAAAEISWPGVHYRRDIGAQAVLVIPRYSLPEVQELFTDEARFGAWLEVEVLAVEAWAQLGVVPAADARAVRERAGFDVAAIHEREKVTDHDVAAFVDVVQEHVGPPAGAWVHYGLTSSDVVDTALALQMTRAVDLLAGAAADLENAIAKRAREFRDTPMVGRTHGIHAEPTTFGAKLALWALQVRRDRERLLRARATIAVGKLSGAVGTYSNVDPAVERYVCEHLGLQPVPATQVLPRDRHAEVMYTCASIGASIESFALEIRHLQRTEVREAEEGFREGEQKGSSAMPHKRNPIKSEQMCGLARVLRGNLQAAVEDVALWHERDISHSSVERIILPDSMMLTYYMLVKFRQVVENLRVHPERMLRNLDASFGLVFSQPVLLALIEAGRTRDESYRMVQRNAMQAWQQERSFRELLAADPEVTGALDAARLDACFDLKRALANVNRVFDALDDLGELTA